LEPEHKGDLKRTYLARIDRVVREAHRRNLRLILTFWTSPCWASSAPPSVKRECRGAWWDRGVDRYPPRDPADYADTLAFLVGRYGARVDAWEVWNEPNHPDFFVSDDQAADYARLLRVAYPAARRAHTGATVLGGSLASADFEFTRRALRHGAEDRFDAWSVHPYSDERSPRDPGLDRWMNASFIRGVPAVRRVLVNEGDPEPLWLTEFGWSTCTVRPPAGECVSERTQARYLELAYRLMRGWGYVDVGVWFKLESEGADPADRVDNYALLRPDGSPKPAYLAFLAASASSRASSPLGGIR
jgi:hypothetical protein